MFIWVTVAAALLGACAVVAVSLYERIAFKQEVINAKNKTVDTLKSNIETAAELKKSIRVLNTNQNLIDTPRLDNSEPLSVVLDALPSTANSSALGASLQQKLLSIDGLTLESLTVKPIAGVEDTGSSDGEEVAVEEEPGVTNKIEFEFSVTVGAGQANVLQEMLRRLEHSIRTVDLTSIIIEQQAGKITLSAEGVAYYQPATKVQLKEESIN